mgnify:CR=1 FL=1
MKMIHKEKLTPMLKQYMEIKENTKEALVFYRLGDFYELFFEDAITASKVLDLVLTSRHAGGAQKAPMCGVPHHAAKSYIQKLVTNGYKVAIVEQVEDPKEAKGIVRREVVEIITPGTFIEHEEINTNEIAALHQDLVYATLVFSDIIEGSLRAIRIMNEATEIIKTLEQFDISELVVDPSIDEHMINQIKDKTSIYISYEASYYEDVKYKDAQIEKALQKLFAYLNYTQKKPLNHFGDVLVLNDLSYLKMDYSSMMNLELLNHSTNKDLSLYSFLNHTQTNIGARALKDALMRPMVQKEAILETQDQIDVLLQDIMLKDTLKTHLKSTYDIHRVIARMSTEKNNAQDFVRLKKTLFEFKQIQDVVPFQFLKAIDPLDVLYETLESTIHDDAPVQLKEGRTFKQGVDQDLDELLSIAKDGKKWLLAYETTQKEKTGIKNLKVGYTRAFGYYIEVSKGQVENVLPEHGFIRKQTLTNAERYITEELQDYETKVLEASDKILEIENKLMKKFTDFTLTYTKMIKIIGDAIGKLDVLFALSEISSYPGYTKPTFTDNQNLLIENGRHPVLERELSDHQYIASSVTFDENQKLLILTGPNMGGKSTYMRMLALNVILAQMGSYVPAEKAILPITDQIFTRMGASDDILMGQSTFMVEMMEAQTALFGATKNSLVLFDEIGRGPSTYDGMALEQAILEYMVNQVSCNTVFSTHYHELTDLENLLEKVKNIHVEVHEEDDHVTFLYRVIEGRANKSYGINVAKLAHLPNSVIERANQNLNVLEAQRHNIDITQKPQMIETQPKDYLKVKTKMRNLDVNQMTPIEALMVLSEIKEILGDDDE